MIFDVIAYIAFTASMFLIISTMPLKLGLIVLVGIGMAIRLVSRRDNGL